MGMSAPGNTTTARGSLTSGENRESIKPFLDRRANDKLDDENNLTFTGTRANMPDGQKPVNLDNRMLALSSVQMPRDMITENGCHVSLCFREVDDPNVHREIARMLIAAFKKRRSSEHETSALSVQSIDQRAG